MKRLSKIAMIVALAGTAVAANALAAMHDDSCSGESLIKTTLHPASNGKVVSLSAGTVELSLSTPAEQNFISSFVKADFAGRNTLREMAQAVGADESVRSEAQIPETLALIPEPSVYMLLGVGLLICGQRFLRRKST